MIRTLVLLWAGLVIGVSFLATPIKFRAESLTLPVALDVGRATFHALGRVEWLLSALLIGAAVRAWRDYSLRPEDWLMVGIVVAIVAFQALVLIPKLDLRVAAVIAGTPMPPSHLHSLFGAIEATKVVVLLGLSAWTGGHT